jgi:DNA-binding transcriptional regulator LsrR (DeoR family)
MRFRSARMRRIDSLYANHGGVIAYMQRRFAEGKTHREIGAELNVSGRLVCYYLAKLQEQNHATTAAKQ